MAQTRADMRERLKKLGDREKVLEIQHEGARQARDTAVMEAHDDGWHVRPIAEQIGRDGSTVHGIIVRETARRQRAEGEH